jgi:hypothetical protein
MIDHELVVGRHAQAAGRLADDQVICARVDAHGTG